MSVRSALLAILTLGPAYGLQLASEFRRRTGGAEAVIDGQMYTTLGRLQRDGVVAALPKDSSGRVRYQLTHQGRTEAVSWLAAPVPQNAPGARDELALKVTLSATLPLADLAELIAAQSELARAELGRAVRTGPADLLADVVLARRRSSLHAELDWLHETSTALGTFAAFGYAPPPRRGRKAKQADTPGA